MNIRHLGILVTLTSAMALAACGGDDKPTDTPPQPSGMPSDAPASSSAEAMTPPAPSTTATQEATPAPPPVKPAKEKIVGKFGQDFSGDVKDAADASAKKSAGKADKDGKKYNAAMDKASKGVAGNTLEISGDTIIHSTNGKADQTLKYEVASSDDMKITVKLGKNDKGKDVKGMTGNTCDITFSDDNTFTEHDCFAKDPKKAMNVVYKRQ